MAAFRRQALTWWNFIQPWVNVSVSSGDQVSAIWAHGIGYMSEGKCTQAHSRILLWWMTRLGRRSLGLFVPISTGWSPNGGTFFETDWHLMLVWLIWIVSAAKWLEDTWPESGSLCWCHFLCQRWPKVEYVTAQLVCQISREHWGQETGWGWAWTNDLMED